MTILENLYDVYYEERENEEAVESMKRMDSLIRQVVYSAEARRELSDELGGVALAYERQGFVHGFRQAMKMAVEIFAAENMKMPD